MKEDRRTRAWGIVATLTVCAACSTTPPESTLDRILEEGVARVGYANEAPFAYRETETGTLVGEAPAIARIMLGRLGVESIEGVLTEFGSLIPGLQAGRYDLIAAGMYIKPERCEQVAFSNPTYGIGEALVVPAGNPLDFHSYEGLRDHPVATIGVVAGAIERTYARAIGIPDDRIVTFPDAPSALASVRTGRVSAYAGTELTARDLLGKDSTGLEQALPFEDPVIDGKTVRGYGAFAFRRDDDELRAAFDRELTAFIGTDEHLALVAPFGFTEAQLPGDVTAAELCAGG